MEVLMNFQILALPRDEFAPLFALADAQLQARGGKRCIADRKPGFPCRVSLEDAAPGESLVLIPFTHQSADSPYRASGPIFVREMARQASLGVNEVPEQLRGRLLSVRAYDSQGVMRDADVVDGLQLESVVGRLLSDPLVQYLHVHFARPGCYACRVDRA
jgi:hypothetical protein